jgi:hypothetical protein
MIPDDESNVSDRFLKRSAVPQYFPQFRNPAALAHLAHCGRGPRYVLVGGTAWYDPKDIRKWLETKKIVGPSYRHQTSIVKMRDGSASIPPKRGRPTKLEQLRRG